MKLDSSHSGHTFNIVVKLLFEFVQHCSMPTVEPEVSESAAETSEETEVTDAQLDSDKQLIYQ